MKLARVSLLAAAGLVACGDRNLGEVHCGTNATRRVPTTKWWESGR
ncbi:MAG: hypothetical protein KF850_19245 [Labilithrix sp.]|nr:hypothetical protein [Labilithrix sp.]